MTAYAALSRGGETPAWTPLPVQYADFALWQREVLGSEDDPPASLISQQLGYWKSALAGLPDQLELPTDHPRPPVQSYAGGRAEVLVDADDHKALVELARATNTTLFMVVHTALAVLLARMSGTNDIAIGTPIAGGRGEAALDDLVGMFVNTMVFRTSVAPATVSTISSPRTVSGTSRDSAIPTSRSNGWSRCSTQCAPPRGILCSKSACRSRTSRR